MWVPFPIPSSMMYERRQGHVGALSYTIPHDVRTKAGTCGCPILYHPPWCTNEGRDMWVPFPIPSPMMYEQRQGHVGALSYTIPHDVWTKAGTCGSPFLYHPPWCTNKGTFVAIPYSRKLSRVKTFANFAVLPASAKVLSANFSAQGLGERVGFSKMGKFYSRNALLYRIRESFHLRKFPAIRYLLE